MSYSFTDFFQMLVLQAQNWLQICQVQQNNNNYYNNDNNSNNNNNNINNNINKYNKNDDDNDNKRCYKLLKYQQNTNLALKDHNF